MSDAAEKWLQENDPDYKNKEKLDYAYFSERLTRKKREKEIPHAPMTMDRTF